MLRLDLKKSMCKIGEGHTNKIELEDDMGMIMTYPTIDSFLENYITKYNANNMLELISSCILQIYENNGEKVYNAKDQTKKELTEFIEQ